MNTKKKVVGPSKFQQKKKKIPAFYAPLSVETNLKKTKKKN